MDTSENRPENDVPEPPMPIADQVSNDDRPEGSAEDEEKKESSLPKSFKRKISVVCKSSPKSLIKVRNTVRINIH
nr:apoptotic chromatin condensation inducer in the nucleus-like [Aotus nancymaae]